MGDHFVQFYENEAFLIDEVALFIGSGLCAGDAGIVISTRPHLDLLEKRLQHDYSYRHDKGAGFGEFIALDAAETLSKFMVDGRPDERRFVTTIGSVIRSVSHGGRAPVRAFGEMVALLFADNNHTAAIQLEELWNNLAERYAFSLLCAYPMNAFFTEGHSTPFHDICTAHTRVCPAEGMRANRGELDRIIATLQQKAKALEYEVGRRKNIESTLSHREKSLRRSNLVLRTLQDCEDLIAGAIDENTLMQDICDAMIKGGYRAAWIGLLSKEDGDRIMPIAIAGQERSYLARILEMLAGRGADDSAAIGDALRSHRAAVINEPDTGQPETLRHDEALHCDFLSKIVLPLAHGDEACGILVIYALEQDAFDLKVTALLMALAQSASIALQSLRYRSRPRTTEFALHVRERAIEASANAIVITSAAGPDYPIEYVNPAFERMTGNSTIDVLGCGLRLLYGNECEQIGIAEIETAAREKREGHAILRNFRKDGVPFWSDLHIAPVKDDGGEVGHFVVVQYDITAAKRLEAELEFQANHDALTGFANRNLLQRRLHQAIEYASCYARQICIVFVDLDRFKLINDNFGHQAGDRLLQQVAERLQSAVRETDTVARIGGDEFVLILPERNDERLDAKVVQRIMDAIVPPLTIETHEFLLTCSIGVATYPGDGKTPELLIRHADMAMYCAKKAGRNNFRFYTPAMEE